MALSSDLISQLVKTTKSDKQKKTESTSYGTTVKYEGRTYVKLDGSDLLTPVTTTAVAEDGERVTVLIKDHVATITGNISSPAARNDTVQEIADEITEVEILVADKVSTKQLEAETARIDLLVSDNVVIRETLTANEADIRDLTADTVEITKKLTATEAEIEALSTTKLDATVADITYATIESLNATNADVYNLNATYASITGKLNAVDADIDKLYADKLNAADAEIMYATIGELEATHAEIDALEAGVAKIDTLEAGVANINTLMFGSATGNTLHTNFANAVIAQLGNAQIKSAMIESVSASKITAGDILTNNIRVMSEDGKLLISDETIQISDGTRVRVQIGKDAANDYSINIWDTDGNLMFSEGGITDSAIKEAIIRNDMVASDANIAASKLDISSLFTEINNSTQTIKSNRILLDADNQTLDVAFESLTSDVESIDGKVTSQGTQLSVVQGKIDSKVWQQDIDNATNELSSQYSTLEQNLNGISVTVGEHTSQIEDIDSRVEQAQSTANQNAADMTQIVTGFNKDIENLQTQIDGSITTWFYEVAPTSSNEPAKNWNTTDLKNIHLGDLYYDTITGYCYRWQVKNNTYSWQRITDTDVTKALSDAAAAQDTADQKRRVFYSQPTVPYEAGDLWVQGSGGDILRCQTPKTSSQSYSQTDWVLASKYTDDTLAATAKNTADSAVSRVSAAETQINQNKQLIELRATKSEVAQTLGGYYTKDQTDAAIQVKSDEIVSTVRAETVVRPVISGQKTQTITVQNALQNSIAGLTLYGKTTQNGTPSPEAPVSLESVGDDGNVALTVSGKNLCPPIKAGGYLAASGAYDVGIASVYSCTELMPVAPKVVYVASNNLNRGISDIHFFAKNGAWIGRYTSEYINNRPDGTAFIAFNFYKPEGLEWVQLEVGSVATAYESYKEAKTIAVSTPNGLPGIPVPSDGNYTDANGQQWICDEIDFARGKYVQRVGVKVYTGNESWRKTGITEVNSYAADNSIQPNAKQSTLPMSTHFVGTTNNSIVGVFLSNEYSAVFGVDKSTLPTLADWIAWLKSQSANGTPLTVLYWLKTPIETDLTAEQIATFNALGNPAGTFTVTSEASLSIELSGIASGKDVEKLADRVANAETKISQTSEQIALMATKTEVAETLGGYATKEETEAAIAVKANEINLSVSEVRTEVDNINVGGRNLIADSSLDTVYSGTKGSSTYKDVWAAKTINIPTASEYVVSFDAKADAEQSIQCFFYSPNTTLTSESSTGGRWNSGDGVSYVNITTEWKRYWVKWTQTAADAVKSVIVGRTFTDSTVYIRAVKLEEGNRATSWSPAPEDFYTREETDAQIKISRDSITSSVSAAYATKTALSETDTKAVNANNAAQAAQNDINNLNIGGRNLVPSSEWICDVTTTGYVWNMNTQRVYVEVGETYTLSCYYNGVRTTDQSHGYAYVYAYDSNDTKIHDLDYITTINGVITKTATETNISYVTVSLGVKNCVEGDVYAVKLEKGNKATDWTPAPEDVEGDITNAQNTANEAQNVANNNADRIEIATTTIQQLANSISSLVRDGNGGTLVQQDSSGLWYFNIGGLEQSLSNTANGLDNLQGIVLDANGQIDVLKSTALALQQRTEYVRSYTDSNGQPCLELGEGDSVFKVRITNTEIQFAEGTDVPAKLNRKMLVIEKAMVKNELQFGDDEDAGISGVWIWKRRSNGNLGLSWKVVGN